MVQKPTQMFIIKHKSSFTDLELLTLKVRCLLKCPRDPRLIFFFQCSTCIYVTAGEESVRCAAGGPLAAPRDSTPDVPSRSRAGGPTLRVGGSSAVPWSGARGQPCPSRDDSSLGTSGVGTRLLLPKPLGQALLASGWEAGCAKAACCCLLHCRPGAAC